MVIAIPFDKRTNADLKTQLIARDLGDFESAYSAKKPSFKVTRLECSINYDLQQF